MVKADEKTTSFLQGWVEIKKSEWIAKLEKLGVTVDIEDLEQKEALGEIQPYERELITDYEIISQKIEKILENSKDRQGDSSTLNEGGATATTNQNETE